MTREEMIMKALEKAGWKVTDKTDEHGCRAVVAADKTETAK